MAGCLLHESYGAHKSTVRTKRGHFSIQTGGTSTNEDA
jgi:hypothetical protein